MTVAAPARPVTAPKPAAPPPFQIEVTKRQEHYLKLLFYGAYGAGKTTLAATAWDVPRMQDCLFLNAEAGELSLPDGMDKIEVKKYATLARVYEFLRLHCRLRDEGNLAELVKLEAKFIKRPYTLTEENVKQYRTVIIDTLSEVHTYLMYQLLNIDMGVALDITPDTAEYKEWGQSSEMTQLLVRSFRDLPMHVIFVCNEQEVEDEKKRLVKRILLPGKLSGKVQGFLDLVGYLDTAIDAEGGIRRRLWLQPGHQRFQAKHRFRNIEATYIDNPTIGQLLELDEEAQNAANPSPPSPSPAAASRPTTGTTTRPGAVRGAAGGRGPVRPAGRIVSRG